MSKFAIIAAVDNNLGIGLKNTLAWNITHDLKNFSRVTASIPKPGYMNAIIMGRKTWESLNPQKRPLENRLNIVLTSSKNLPKELICDPKMNPFVRVCRSLNLALEMCEKLKDGGMPEENKILLKNVFVIGGSAVYEEAIKNSLCERVDY